MAKAVREVSDFPFVRFLDDFLIENWERRRGEFKGKLWRQGGLLHKS